MGVWGTLNTNILTPIAGSHLRSHKHFVALSKISNFSITAVTLSLYSPIFHDFVSNAALFSLLNLSVYYIQTI